MAKAGSFQAAIITRQAMKSIQPLVKGVPIALSWRIKRPGRETDHSPLTSAQVKKGGALHPRPYMSSWWCA